MPRPKLTPCLWFNNNADEAVNFYLSVFDDAHVLSRQKNYADWPGGKAGEVVLIEFEIAGQRYQALNGGPGVEFNESVSLSVSCRDQAEVDRYWEALMADGGEPIMCGWLKDRFGLRWQIVPEIFYELVSTSDTEKSKRVMTAMTQMVKLDIATLRQASDG